MKLIIDPWGIHRFEYISGYVNEYLTKDSIEFLKSVCIVDNYDQVHERRFYLIDGTLDYTDYYEWDTEGNCTKKNNIEYYYDSEKFNPLYKEYRYWRIGTAGSINCLDESIDESGTTEYSYGYPMIGRYPRNVTINKPGSGNDQRWYYYRQLEIPVVRVVYDFDIGDVYHSIKGWYDWNMGSSTQIYRNHIIVDKLYFEDEDKLYYVEEVKSERITEGVSGSIFDSYTQTILHTNLDSLINKQTPNWTYVDSTLYNGRVAHMANYNEGYYHYELEFVCGFGSIKYRQLELESGSYERTFYVKKGDEEWGVPYEIILPPDPIDTLTIGEAFDFYIGDIFHYAFDENGAEGYRNNTLINKYYSTNHDTVYYIWNILEEGDSTAWWHPDIPYQIEYYDTTVYTKLDKNIRTICKVTHNPLYYTEYIYNNNYEYNGRNVFGIKYYTSYSDPTLYHRYRFKHCRSLGRVVFENDESGYILESDSLIYYNKSGEEWGTPHNILSIEENPQDLKILSTEYYDFYGRRISKPKTGLYIEVQITNKGIISRKYFVR